MPSLTTQATKTTAALGANGVFTGPWVHVAHASKLKAMAFASHTGTLYIDQSQEGVTVDFTTPGAAIPASGSGVSLVTDVIGMFARMRIVNGATGQSGMRAAMNLHVDR